LTQGTVLTIMKGRSVTGSFHTLSQNAAWHTGGYLFKVSYRNNSVTLTVMHAVPPTAPPGKNK
jgi:subtilase-type serine protease